MARTEVVTPSAPRPAGAYSQGIQANGFLFVAGQGGFDTSGTLLLGIEQQTVRALRNIEAVLEAAGASAQDVTKVSVFLSDLQDFEAMNQAYEKFFAIPYPARTTVQCTLPQGMKIEIDAVAAIGATGQQVG
jgi:2-iminobutanoate/2-iminopropanoate deaminase